MTDAAIGLRRAENGFEVASFAEPDQYVREFLMTAARYVLGPSEPTVAVAAPANVSAIRTVK